MIPPGCRHIINFADRDPVLQSLWATYGGHTFLFPSWVHRLIIQRGVGDKKKKQKTMEKKNGNQTTWMVVEVGTS